MLIQTRGPLTNDHATAPNPFPTYLIPPNLFSFSLYPRPSEPVFLVARLYLCTSHIISLQIPSPDSQTTPTQSRHATVSALHHHPYRNSTILRYHAMQDAITLAYLGTIEAKHVGHEADRIIAIARPARTPNIHHFACASSNP